MSGVLWVCQSDRVEYAPGARACPHCGCPDYWVKGEEPPLEVPSMTGLAVASLPVNEIATSAVLPDRANADVDATEPEEPEPKPARAASAGKPAAGRKGRSRPAGSV